MLSWTVHLNGPRRSFCSTVVAVGHKVYSFGGYGNMNNDNINVHVMKNWDLIDVHVFNTVSLRWMNLPPVTNVTEERPLEIPSNRVGHTAVLIEHIIYIWGGVEPYGMKEVGNQIYVRRINCDVLYAFDVDTHMWFKPNVSGTVPEVRWGHSDCVRGKVMYIFGGLKLMATRMVLNKLNGYYNDIHKLDTATMAWSLINARGTPPSISSRHSTTIIGTKMFVFGGRGDENPGNNISVFDTDTDCWLSTPSTQLLPEGRWCHHSAFAHNGELYIFGGYDFPLNRAFSNLWKFNPETFSWRKVEPKGEGPSLRSRLYGMCMVGDRIVLFGEYRLRSIAGDNLYILDLSPSLKMMCKKAVIRYGLEQSGVPHDIRWEIAAMTTHSK